MALRPQCHMWEPGSESFVELSTTALARSWVVSVGLMLSPYNVSTSPKAQTLVLKAIRLCNVGPSDGPYVSLPSI